MKKLRILGGFAVLISTVMVLPSPAVPAEPKPISPIWEPGLTVKQRYTVVTESCELPGSKDCPLSGIRNCGVQDHETGLMWEAIVSGSSSIWKGAPFLCYNKVGCGRLGWRLPTIAELTTHIDPSESPTALPAGHPYQFLDLDSTPLKFWSATRTVNNFRHVRAIDLEALASNFVIVGDRASDTIPGDRFRIWCVRGGGGSNDGPDAAQQPHP